MQYKCKAIILKTTKLGEADKILNLYCPEHGSIRAVAKGSRKANGGFGGRAQVLNYCDFLIGKGKNLDVISQAKLIEDFGILRTNYDSLTFACFMVDVIDSITAHDDCYGDHFELLYGSLSSMNLAKEPKDYLQVLTGFLWGLILQLGYKPELHRCCLTGIQKPREQTAKYFNLKDGGIVSSQAYKDYECSNPYQNDIYSISSNVYKALIHLDGLSTQNSLPSDKLQQLMSDPKINSLLEEIVNEGKLNSEPSDAEDTAKSILGNINLDGFSILDLQEVVKLLHKHLEYRMHREFKSWKLMEPCLN